ncbi:MAG: HtaA domain-containing protein [Solirubrobacterales bacterium]
MLAKTNRPARPLAAAIAALIALAILFGLVADRASATSATSDSVVTLALGKSGTGLRAAGVKLSALSPAKLKKSNLSFKVSDISVTSATQASIVLRGGIKLKKGKRSVKIQGLLINADGKRVKITGKVGSKRLTILSGSSSIQLVASASQQVVAPAIKVKLGGSTGKAVRSALKLKKSPGGSPGKLITIVKADLPKSTDPNGVTLQDLAGAPLTRPLSAVNVSTSSLKWWLRDSWVRYIDFSLPQDGAVGDAPIKDTAHVCKDTATSNVSRVYALNLPFKSGWWDSASQTGAFYYGGGVRWYAPDRGIDITASDAEVEISGGTSRVIFRFYDASANTLKRGAFLTINTTAPLDSTPSVGPGGAISRLKSTIIADPVNSPFGSFVGQYTGNPGWGCFDLGFNLGGTD